MNEKILINNLFNNDKYSLFLEYCSQCNYVFIDELKSVDYIAFSAKYNIPFKVIKTIKYNIDSAIVENYIPINTASTTINDESEITSTAKESLKIKNQKWDTEEELLLVKLYFTLLESQSLNRSEQIESLSQILNKRAATLSITHDDRYRNATGIIMKLQNISYIDTSGVKGLSSISDLDKQTVDLYKSNPAEFDLQLHNVLIKYHIENLFYVESDNKKNIATSVSKNDNLAQKNFGKDINIISIPALKAQNFKDEISEIGLSVRAINALNHAGINTIAQLIEQTESSLLVIDNLGAKTVTEILKKIEDISCRNVSHIKNNTVYCEPIQISDKCRKYIDNVVLLGEKLTISSDALSTSDNIVIQKVDQAMAEFDSEIVFQAYSTPKRVIPIINMFNEYIFKEQLERELYKKFEKIPCYRKHNGLKKYISSFYSQDIVNDLKIIEPYFNGIETVFELKSSFNKISEEHDHKRIMLNLLSLLNIDIVKLCEMAVLDTFSEFKSDKMDFVIRHRLIGETLESISQELNITRERVRQIEKKVKIKILRRINRIGINIISFISAERNGDPVITKHELMDYFSNCKEQKLICELLVTEYSIVNYEYDKELELFMPIFDNDVLKITNHEIANMENIIPDENISTIVNNISANNSISEEIVQSQFNLIYKHVGQIYYKGRLLDKDKYEYVLKNYYPCGLKLYVDEDMLRFKEKIEEVFDDQCTKKSNRAIQARIADVSVLLDRGMHIHQSYIKIPDELLREIDEYIINSKRIILPYHELFEAFKEKLLQYTNVSNRYCLQGALKSVLSKKYFFSKDYLSKIKTATFDKEIELFIKEHGEVTKEEIFSEFPGISEIMVSMKTNENENIVCIDYGVYLHSSLLNILEDDYSIKDLIESMISTNPISSRKLLDILWNTHADFLTRNAITKHTKLFGVLKYMFDDKFRFSRPFIAKIGTEELNNLVVIKNIIKDYDELRVSELLEICEYNQLLFLSNRELIREINDMFLRTEADLLERTDDNVFDDETINSIEELIKDSINQKGYLVAANIKDYLYFPQLPYQWTPFLLRAIVEKYLMDKIEIIDIPTTDTYAMNTIFIDSSSDVENYENLLRRIIKEEHNKDPFSSISEILDWIKSKGLFAGKPPKCLIDGTIIHEDEYSKIIL